MTFTDDFRNGTRSYKIIDMAAGFHYIVKAKLIRYKNADEIKLLEVEEKFENAIPFLAREAAFNFYQNYIDVLLESKGKKYFSDIQAREELQSFISTGTTTKVKFGDKEFEFDDSEGNGIGVFLVVDFPKEKEVATLSLKEGDELLLHGIGNLIGFSYNTDYVIMDLAEECELYEHNNHETKGKTRKIIYCNRDEWGEGYLGNGEWLEGYEEPNEYKILETPFDWTGYDKPYWWGEPEEEEEGKQEVQQPTKTVEQIIEGGEGNQVEFKPALLYNFKTERAGISVKGKIATAICSFLNSNGGLLFIGLDDDGKPIGLDKDFSLADGKKPKDFFQNEFDQMIEHFLSFSVMANITAQFYNMDGKEIFIVIIEPSKHRPIFMNGQNGKEFWIRGQAGNRQPTNERNRQITDLEELANYCIERWTN